MNIGHIDDIDCIECGAVLHCQVKNCTGMAIVWAWNNIYCIKHKVELKDSINKLIFNKVILH